MSPIASAARPTCEPRVVVRYPGAHISDLGSHLEIIFEGEPRRGISWSLQNTGWRKLKSGAFRKPSCPASILQAQEIVGTFYGAQQ